VDLTSSVKAALLLSQSIYWTRHGRDIARNGGWFHKTTEQWAMETGLSPKEQASAREVLRNLALLDDQRIGDSRPAALQVEAGRARRAARRSDRWPSAGGRLERPARACGDCSVRRWPSTATLVEVAGGVHAGLMLSRALHLTRLQVRRRLDQWIVSSAARWFEELGLTRREQETARRDLVRAGLWEECLRGIPPSLVARIRLDCLLTLLTEDVSRHGTAWRRSIQSVTLAQPTIHRRANQDCGIPAALPPNPPRQFGPIREHGSPESAALLMNHSTGESLQPQNTGSPKRMRRPPWMVVVS
jgi:hypothetical protein